MGSLVNRCRFLGTAVVSLGAAGLAVVGFQAG
jgi:hypothetical protein